MTEPAREADRAVGRIERQLGGPAKQNRHCVAGRRTERVQEPAPVAPCADEETTSSEHNGDVRAGHAHRADEAGGDLVRARGPEPRALEVVCDRVDRVVVCERASDLAGDPGDDTVRRAVSVVRRDLGILERRRYA